LLVVCHIKFSDKGNAPAPPHTSWICAQEHIRKQLDEDALTPPLPFGRFIRAHVEHPWMRAGVSADEALLLTSRVMGTCACAAYVTSVRSYSSSSSPSCVPQDDLLLYASKTLGVSLLAILGGSLATSAFAFIGQRQGTCRKVMMWLLVHAYICFCLLFCTTLIANVLESELRVWSLRVSASMIQIVVAFPLGQACAAHRMYYRCLQDKDEVRKLRQMLHLTAAKTAWEGSSLPSSGNLAPPPPPPPPTCHPDSPPPESLKMIGSNDEEHPSPPSSTALQPCSASELSHEKC